MIEVEAPDGTIIEFPAGTDDATIDRVMRENFAPQPSKKSRSAELMDAAIAAPSEDEYRRLMAEANAAAVEDGETPDGVVFNPNTGALTDIGLRQDKGRANAVMQGVGQGVSFGGMDEAVGALYGLTGPGTYQQNRDYALASMRGDLKSARDNHRKTTVASEVGGGLLNALGTMGLVGTGKSLVGTMGRNIGMGAATGAAYGFGQAEGGAENRLAAGRKGAAFGGIAGAAAQPLAWGMRQAGNALVGAYRNVIPGASQAAIRNALGEVVEQSGQSVDDVVAALRAAANEGQGNFTVADALGEAGQRQLAGTARRGGSARQVAAEFLDSRQAGQGERVAQFVDDALGVGGKTADATRAGLTESRRAAADAAYGAARDQAGAVNLNKAIGAIDDLLMRDPILGDTPLTRGAMGERLMQVRSQLTNGDTQLIDFNTVLNLKSDLFEQMQRNPRLAATMRPVYSALDDALEGASSGYRAANDSYRAASRVIDQLDEGAAAFRPSQRGADTAAQYAGLSGDAERAAFRAGYGDRALAGVERGAFGANKARPFTSQKSAEEIGAMATDPARFARQIGRENTMFATRSAALGGSKTADNLADMLSTNWLERVPTGPMDAVRSGVNALGHLAKGQNPATREAIVRQLLSTGDEAAQALAAAVARGDKLTANQQLMVDTLLFLSQGAARQIE